MQLPYEYVEPSGSLRDCGGTFQTKPVRARGDGCDRRL